MLRTPLGSTLRRPARLVALLAALVLLPGCAALFRRSPPPQLGFQRLLYETARVLDVADPDPAYYRERARLEVMGRELDAVLVSIITDPSADDNVRVNAIALLADRRGFNTTGVLRRVLVSNSNDALRAA